MDYFKDMNTPFNFEEQYAMAFYRILNHGIVSNNRTGINTLAV